MQVPRSMLNVDYQDFNSNQYKELFQEIRMANAERDFKIFGIVPPKKEKKILSAEEVLKAMNLKLREIETLKNFKKPAPIELK